MKKIIIILSCLFFLSGCNYLDLTDIGIISLMAIKYENNKYNLILELRENIKSDEEASIIYQASDTSLEKAFEQIATSIDRTLYLIDLNIILIDSNTINSKLPTILDYFTRDNMIGTNFNIIVDNNPEETIKLINSKEKIAGEYIMNIFDNRDNNVINNKYEEFLKDYMNEFKDIILPVGSIENNNYFIKEAIIFSDNKIVGYLPFNMVETYNLLNNTPTNYYYQIDYNGKSLVYKVSSNKTKIKYQNNRINIDVKLNGSFIEIEDTNITDKKIEKELTNILNNKIKLEIDNLINKCLQSNSDILGFKKAYFNKQRTKLESIYSLKYTINIETKINREGLIFNSLGDIYENNK